MDAQKRSYVDVVWDFFCSLKLTIFTLILLAATSIIGTVIEQGKTPEEVASQLGWNLDLLRFLDKWLNAFDMYHSRWFLALLGLFAINLICCSIKRLPRVLRIVREPVLVADDNLLRSLSNADEISVRDDLATTRDKAVAFLGKHFAAPVTTEQDGKVYLYAEKGAWSRFGVYITHLSILVIFIGAIIGTLWGFKGNIWIVSGEENSQFMRFDQPGETPLGFTLRCDDFSVSFYEGTRRPKEYRSVITVIDNGQEVIKQRPVIVNDPLTYKGITFYQSSYQPVGAPVYTFNVTERASGTQTTVSGREGEHLSLPGGAALIPLGYAENYQNFGPAAQLSIDKGDHKHGNPFVVLQNYPTLDDQRGDAYIVSLVSAAQHYATGLQVAKDPGVEVVWLGCFLMVIGIIVAFFLSHRRIWVVLAPQGSKTQLRIGGNAHRNQPAFELFFDDLKKDLKNEFVS